MHATGTDLSTVAAVVDVLGQEQWIVVAWSEWLELFEDTEELR